MKIDVKYTADTPLENLPFSKRTYYCLLKTCKNLGDVWKLANNKIAIRDGYGEVKLYTLSDVLSLGQTGCDEIVAFLSRISFRTGKLDERTIIKDVQAEVAARNAQKANAKKKYFTENTLLSSADVQEEFSYVANKLINEHGCKTLGDVKELAKSEVFRDKGNEKAFNFYKRVLDFVRHIKQEKKAKFSSAITLTANKPEKLSGFVPKIDKKFTRNIEYSIKNSVNTDATR